jgi:hypothetical protein
MRGRARVQWRTDIWLVWVGTFLHRATCRYTVVPPSEGESMGYSVYCSPFWIGWSQRPQIFTGRLPSVGR